MESSIFSSAAQFARSSFSDEGELFTMYADADDVDDEESVCVVSVNDRWMAESEDHTMEVPSMSSEMLPEPFKPWIMDLSERMQMAPELFMAPALVSFASLVGKKIGISPKQFDDWVVVPNLWGAVVAESADTKSRAFIEALKPLDKLSVQARSKMAVDYHKRRTNQMIGRLQIEALKDMVKTAFIEGDYEKIEGLQNQISEVICEIDTEMAPLPRYKTNNCNVDNVARLLGENPNGLLILKHDLHDWLEVLSDPKREDEREFFSDTFADSGFHYDDVCHVSCPSLSVFGGLDPQKLQLIRKKTTRGSGDEMLRKFQVLIYSHSPQEWRNIDSKPDFLARDIVFKLFRMIDQVSSPDCIPVVRFSDPAQEVFNAWSCDLENRLRKNTLINRSLISHVAKYRALLPALALLFWILEHPDNMHAQGKVSFSSIILAIQWCEYLEKHAEIIYESDQKDDVQAIRSLDEYINKGQQTDSSAVKNVHFKHWA